MGDPLESLKAEMERFGEAKDAIDALEAELRGR